MSCFATKLVSSGPKIGIETPNSIMQLLKNIDVQVTQISQSDVTITTSPTVIGALTVEYFHLDQRLFDNISKSITACGGP